MCDMCPPTDLPSPPLEVTAVLLGANSAMVSWLPPSDTGGAPIISYIIHRKQAHAENWEEVSVTEEDWCSILYVRTYQPIKTLFAFFLASFLRWPRPLKYLDGYTDGYACRTFSCLRLEWTRRDTFIFRLEIFSKMQILISRIRTYLPEDVRDHKISFTEVNFANLPKLREIHKHF